MNRPYTREASKLQPILPKCAHFPEWQKGLETDFRPVETPMSVTMTNQRGYHDSRSTVTLHWKDHGYRLVTGLQDLVRRNFLVDTDINFNGTLQLKAHRLIMSVFLPSVEHCDSTDLNLQDVAEEADDVRVLVEFMYAGEVTVREDRIEPLRRMAKALRFEGLSKAIDGGDEWNSSRAEYLDAKSAMDYRPLPVVQIYHDTGARNKSQVTVTSTGFQCDLCDAVYAQMDQLRRHNVDGRQLFACGDSLRTLVRSDFSRNDIRFREEEPRDSSEEFVKIEVD